MLMRCRWTTFLLLCCLSCMVPARSHDQELGGSNARLSGSTLLRKLDTRIKATEDNQQIDTATKDKLLETYRQARASVVEAMEDETAETNYKQAITTAPAQAEQIRAELGRISTATPGGQDLRLAALSHDELENRRIQEEADLAVLQAKLSGLDMQLAEQQTRPEQARAELTDAQAKLAEHNASAPSLAHNDASPLLNDAQLALHQARAFELRRQVALLEQELTSLLVRTQLLVSQRDLSSRQLSQAQDRLKTLKDFLNSQRQSEAEQTRLAAEERERAVANKHPLIQQRARRNRELSQQLSHIVDMIDQVTRARAGTEQRLKRLTEEFRNTRQKIEIAGLSQALGQVLLEQRRQLPDLRRFQQGSKVRQQEISSVGLQQLQVAEQRRELDDVDIYLERLLREPTEGDTSPEALNAIRSELRGLAKEERELVIKLADADSNYLRALGELDFVDRQFLDGVGSYAAFLDERLLWIPNASRMGLHTVTDLAKSTAWLLAPTSWRNVLTVSWSEALRHPLEVAGFAILVGALLLGQRPLRKAMIGIAEKVNKPTLDHFRLTLQALTYTLMLATPGAIVVGYLGWRMQADPDAPEFVRAVGTGLLALAWPWFFLQAFRRLCRPQGVADLHFHWQDRSLQLLRRHLSGFMAVALPATFIEAMAEFQSDAGYRYSLGRVAFIVIMLALTIFLQRVLRPEGGALELQMKGHPEQILARTRKIWYPLSIGTPLLLALLAALGYFYTAGELADQMFKTVWLLMAAVIGHDLVIRWLTLENRRLARIKGREKREAERVAQVAKAGTAESSDAAPENLDLHAVDMVAINEHTRHLLRILISLSLVVGIWLIWAKVLPALGILDHIDLWNYTVLIDGQEVNRPVTLANLALAIIFGLTTYGAARNLPGVLEILILQRLNMQPGSRYAITQVARYAIVTAGVLATFNVVGGSWSQVRWLIAALGVGLGFGLQEIFANFISGLIILFERPIRVGDTITVGDLSGTVSRIRIRSTTIMDWDHRELVVPNKTFITDKLVNWTLSDTITRVVIRLGLAYGSDIPLAHRTMLEVVRSNALVMKTPEPNVFFVGFGEHALNFEILVFVAELGKRSPAAHQLYVGIQDALATQGIGIATPQREARLMQVLPPDVVHQPPHPNHADPSVP
jgi:potassium-dependent mechanosensitive channel